MLNKDGITKVTGVSPVQILANVEHQVSVGIVVNQSAGVSVGTRTIVKAGTPLTGNLDSRQTPFTKANSNGTDVKGILLHDVDVTSGNANGTMLLFGFVNLNRIDATTQEALSTEVKAALPMIKIFKY